MMTAQDKLDLFASLLLTGTADPERQIAMGRELAEIGIEHRKLARFRDETVLNAQEDAEIAEAVRVAPPVNVVPFSRCSRPAPVRAVMPPVYAEKPEVWR